MRDRGTPDGCRRVAHSVPSAAGCGSPTTAFFPQPTCIVPASRWIRCHAELSGGLCPSSSKPRGIEGSRSPCRRAASSGACADAHEKACGSARWRPRPLPRPSSRGHWPPSGSPPKGRLSGRPQHDASSPVCPYPSGSGRSFGPPGSGYARRVQRCPLPVDLVGLTQPIQQDSVQALPYARLVPLLEASPASHSRAAAHLLGQHLPGYAALEDEQDPGEGGTVVDAGPAAVGLGRLFGQQWLNYFPQLVGNKWFSHLLILPTTRFC